MACQVAFAQKLLGYICTICLSSAPWVKPKGMLEPRAPSQFPPRKPPGKPSCASRDENSCNIRANPPKNKKYGENDIFHLP